MLDLLIVLATAAAIYTVADRSGKLSKWLGRFVNNPSAELTRIGRTKELRQELAAVTTKGGRVCAWDRSSVRNPFQYVVFAATCEVLVGVTPAGTVQDVSLDTWNGGYIRAAYLPQGIVDRLNEAVADARPIEELARPEPVTS